MFTQWFLIALIVTTAAHLVWDIFYRRIPFWKTGMNHVIQVVQWLPDSQQKTIYARGWVTKYNWFVIRRRVRQQTDRELEGIGFH